MASLPRVSVIVPTTFSRARFARLVARNITCQTYPHNLLELVVVGDTDTRTRELYTQVFADMPDIKCKYYACDITQNIGKKRNFACEKATTKTIACIDDDDCYQKCYIEYAVQTMAEQRVNMVACRDMVVFYPLHEGRMIMVRGSSGHEGTFVFKKQHWKEHRFAQTPTGEGITMVNGKFYNEMDIRRVMICFAHGNNTYDKTALLKCPAVDIPEDLRRQLLELWATCS